MSNISDDVNNPNTGYTFDNSFGYNSGHWSGKLVIILKTKTLTQMI